MNELVWRQLLGICQQLSQLRAVELLLTYVLDAALDVFGAEWGGVILRKPDGALDFPAGRAAGGQSIFRVERRIDRALLDQMLTSQTTLILETNRDAGPPAVIGIPLVTPDGVIGAFYLAVSDPHAEIEPAFSQFFSRQVAFALENAILHERLDMKNTERQQSEIALLQAHDRMMMMRAFDMELTRQLDVDYVLTIALDTAIRLSGAETGAVGLFDEGEIRMTHAIGAYQHAGQGTFALDSGIVGRVIRSREPDLVKDVIADPDYIAVIPETRAQMVMPIISQDQLLGVFNLETSRADQFSQEVFTFIKLLVGRVAVALDNARLFEAEQHRRSIEQTLRQVIRSLSETLELNEVFNGILYYLRQVVEFDTASVLQFNPAENTLEIMACYGFDKPQEMIGIVFQVREDDPLRRSLFDQKPLHVHDVVAQDDLFRVHRLKDLHIRSWLNVPLVLRDEVIGTITLDRHEVKPFSEQEIDLVTVFASHAAVAMGNARSYYIEQQRRYVEETLRTAAELLNETLELSEVMDRIMMQIRAVVPCDTGSIQEVREDGLQIIACYGFNNPDQIIGQRFALKDHPIMCEITSNLHPVHIVDIHTHPLFREYMQANPDYQGRTWLGVPLMAHGSFIGQITLDRNQVNPYTDDEIELAGAFASHAAVALENARLFEAEQKQRQMEKALREAASSLSQTLELDQLLDLILAQVRRVIPFDSASIQRLRGGQIEIIAGLDLVDPQKGVGERLPLDGDGLINEIIHSKNPVVLVDAAQDPRFSQYVEQWHSSYTRSWLGVPLISKDRVLGVITLERIEVNAFSPEEVERAVALANHAALALENAELYQQQQAYAHSLEQSLDERERLIEELDAFAHTVAHDLKNPLSLVIAYSELLRASNPEELLSDFARGYIYEVAHNAERMQGIIDALLVLAGVRQAGEVQIGKLDMGPIVNEARHRLDNVIRERKVELVVPDEWPPALGYAPWIEEVWTNYISNAIKYGGEPPRVEIGATLMNGAVRFWVRDNGVGIAPDDFDQLFTPFTRLSRTRKVEGHGLGLSIVQRIVEKLGGEVGVESVVGQGSTFSFTLPMLEK